MSSSTKTTTGSATPQFLTAYNNVRIAFPIVLVHGVYPNDMDHRKFLQLEQRLLAAQKIMDNYDDDDEYEEAFEEFCSARGKMEHMLTFRLRGEIRACLWEKLKLETQKICISEFLHSDLFKPYVEIKEDPKPKPIKKAAKLVLDRQIQATQGIKILKGKKVPKHQPYWEKQKYIDLGEGFDIPGELKNVFNTMVNRKIVKNNIAMNDELTRIVNKYTIGECFNTYKLIERFQSTKTTPAKPKQLEQPVKNNFHVNHYKCCSVLYQMTNKDSGDWIFHKPNIDEEINTPDTRCWDDTVAYLAYSLVDTKDCDSDYKIFQNFIKKFVYVDANNVLRHTKAAEGLNKMGIIAFLAYIQKVGFPSHVFPRVRSAFKILYEHEPDLDLEILFNNRFVDHKYLIQLPFMKLYKEFRDQQILAIREVLNEFRISYKKFNLVMDTGYAIAYVRDNIKSDKYQLSTIGTMFSVAGEVNQFAKNASELLDANRLSVHQALQMAGPTMVEAKTTLSDLRTTVNKLNKFLDSNSENANKITEKIEQTLDATKQFIEPLIQVSETIPGEMSTMSLITDMVAKIIKSIQQFVPDMFTPIGLTMEDLSKVNLSDITGALSLYVVYVNTESKFLKTIVFLMILRKLGLLKLIIKGLTAIKDVLFEFFFESQPGVPQTSGTSGGKTFSTLLKFITENLDTENAKWSACIAGVLITGLCGAKIGKNHLFGLGQSISETMRNVSFISLGIVGFERIINYTKVLFEHIISYVNKYYLKKEPPKPDTTREEFLTWILECELYATENGLARIHIVKEAKDVAVTLLPRGLAYQEWIDKQENAELRSKYQNAMKQAREIQNAMFRLSQASKPRITPFHIQLTGKPGIGKSTIMENICEEIKSRYYPTEPDTSKLRYARSPTDHFDGYSGQKIYMIDDYAAIVDVKEIAALITLISNVPILVPMAHLQDKGQYFVSEFILSSTNVPYPSVSDIQCPEALLRRRHALVEVVCDSRVLNSSDNTYDPKLFAKFYPSDKQYNSKFPHLRFIFKEALVPSHLVDKELEKLDPNYMSKGVTFEQFLQYSFDKRDRMANSERQRFCSKTHDENVIEQWEKLMSELERVKETFPSENISSALLENNDDGGLSSNFINSGTMDDVERVRKDESIMKLLRESLIEDIKTVKTEVSKLVKKQAASFKNFIDPISLQEPQPSTSGTAGSDSEYESSSEELCEDYEAKRRARILKKKGKFVPQRPIVQLHSFPVRKQLDDDTYYQVRSDYDYIQKHSYAGVQKIVDLPAFDDENSLLEKMMFEPDRTKSPWKDRNATALGENIGVSYEFLRNCKKIDNHWYVNVSKLAKPYEESDRHELESQGILNYLNCPFVFGNIRRSMHTFIEIWSEEQRLWAVENVTEWQHFVTWIKRKPRNIVKSFLAKLRDMFFNWKSYVKYFWETIKENKIVIFSCIGYFGVIFSIQALVKLFAPHATSKVLHHGQNPRGVRISSGTSANRDSQIQTTRKHMTMFLTRTDKGIVWANAIGFDGHYFCTVKHFVDDIVFDEDGVGELHYLSDIRSKDATMLYVKKEHIYTVSQSDIAFIYLPYTRSYPSSKTLFVNDKDIEKHLCNNVTHLYIDDRGDCIVSSFMSPRVVRAQRRSIDGNVVVDDVVIYRGNPIRGSSGGPVLASDNYANGIICGIQSSAGCGYSYVSIVSSELVKEAKVNLPQSIIHEGPLSVTEGTSQKEELLEPGTPIVGVIPKEDVHDCVMSTRLIRTPIADMFRTDRMPAILNPFDSRVPKGSHPIAHSVNKFGRDQILALEPYHLEKATEAITEYCEYNLRGTKKILTFEESIRGLPYDGFSPVNLKTSMGLPWVLDKFPGKLPGKHQYIEYSVDGSITKIDPRLQIQFDSAVQSLEKGIIPQNSAYDFMKDELRPIKKAIGPPVKTRSITVMDFTLTLAYRKYFLSFEAAFHRAADGMFQGCVGINPESLHWRNLYNCLASVSGSGFDLDASNWDGHFPPDLFMSCVNVINTWYGDAEDSPNGIARRALCENALFCFVQFGDCLYQKPKGMPSGFAGTAIVNTLGHMILFYYFYRCIMAEHALYEYLPFSVYEQLVCVRFYGDDVITTVSDEISHIINGVSMGEIYSHYGWPTTSAAKDGAIVPFKPLEECQFLKRNFIRDPVYPSLIVWGALDRPVIEDLCYWMRKQSEQLEQFYSNLNDALEFACPHGKEYYEDLRRRINTALSTYSYRNINVSYSDMRLVLVNRYLLKPDNGCLRVNLADQTTIGSV